MIHKESGAVRCTGTSAGCFAPTLLTGLFEVSVGTDGLHDTFLIHYFLQPPQGFVNTLASSNFYLSHEQFTFPS